MQQPEGEEDAEGDDDDDDKEEEPLSGRPGGSQTPPMPLIMEGRTSGEQNPHTRREVEDLR